MFPARHRASRTATVRSRHPAAAPSAVAVTRGRYTAKCFRSRPIPVPGVPMMRIRLQPFSHVSPDRKPARQQIAAD